MRDRRFTDETLGAYADGQLDRAARSCVEAGLAADPAALRRLGALLRLSSAVRDAAGERASPGLQVQSGRPPPRRHSALGAARTGWARRHPQLMPSAAAGFIAGVCCALLALLVGGREPPNTWQQHALSFHESYLAATAAERIYPLDAAGDDPEALERLIMLADEALPALPDFAAEGYALRGARLLATAEGPLTYLLYASDNEPLLGVAMLRGHAAARRGKLHTHGSVKLWEWSDGPYSFAVGGTHEASLLRRLADAIRHAGAESSTDSI